MTRALVFVLASCAACAQSFEVASVKPAAPVNAAAGSGKKPASSRKTADPAQVRYTNATFKRLLIEAYGVRAAQIDGPAWIDDKSYDIVAKMPDGAPKTQIPAMLRTLLADRFRLVAHRETRQERLYVLLARKPRLQPSAAVADDIQVSFDGTGHMKFTGFTLAAFAEALSNLLHSPVIDQSGIPGRFDFTLNVTMQDLMSAGPSIFTGVHDLGLKLESRKAPVEHVVVDHADQVPTPN